MIEVARDVMAGVVICFGHACHTTSSTEFGLAHCVAQCAMCRVAVFSPVVVEPGIFGPSW